MIQVSNLAKSYGEHLIFENVSFTVNSGERIGLVGRNGHGKTTLFRMILGREKPDSGIISIPVGYTIGHLSQHISFKEDSVLKEGCLGLKAGDDNVDETYKVKAVLMGLGFASDDFSINPMELSGGYQVRLNLAKLLIEEPNLLLLDEPTNYLDIVSIRWLAQFLRNWRNELILITHDRAFMDSVTTHTMGIHRCRLRKIAGGTEKLYNQLLTEEEVHEKTRINDEKRRREIEQFITRFRAQATKAKAVQSKIKALQKKEMLEEIREIKNLDFQFNAAPFLGKFLLEAEDVSFSFDEKGAPLINGLSVAVSKKDRIALIGKNGKGKSTLLNLLSGGLSPQKGAVVHNPKLRLAYFGQTNINRLDPDKTVEDEILEAMPEYNRRAARNICGIMMFEGDNALKKISVLSGGEKSRVLLGKMLVSPANLLLLDEPSNHLDMESIDSLIEAIDVFEGAVMIVTHSEMILNAIANRLIVFDKGKVRLFEGTYQEFLDSVGWQDEDRTQAGSIESGSRNPHQNRMNNKKDIRKLRAELVTARSRTLGALQSRIAEIEETIIRLEEEIKQNTDDILKVSVKGDGPAIKALSKSINDLRQRIDELFDELSALTDEFENRTAEFDERLSKIALG